MIKKAIASATGKDTSHINAEYKKVGDLGLVAMVTIFWQNLILQPELTHTIEQLRTQERAKRHSSSRSH